VINNFIKNIYSQKDKNHLSYLDTYKVNLVYGNGNKTSKIKPYIYNEFEFYYDDIIDNAAYIEQLIIESLITIPKLKNNLEDSIIFLETSEVYYIMFLSITKSKTIKLNKNFTIEQIKIILNEIIEENTKKLIVIFQYTDNLVVNILNINKNTKKETLNIENYSIPINIVSPNIIYSKSLKVKENIDKNKKDFLLFILIIFLFLGNQFYFEKKIDKFITSKNNYYKSLKIKTLIKKINIQKKINKLKNELNKTEIKKIKLKNIKDFKQNYQTEINKLF